MKNLFFRLKGKLPTLKLVCLLVFTALWLSACGGGSDDDGVGNVVATPGSWKLGDFEYEAGVTVGSTGDNNIVAVVSTTEEDMSLGEASGSAISFSFLNQGEGLYAITAVNESVTDADVKRMAISCTIGSATVNATRYDSNEDSSGTATVTRKDDGFSISVSSPVRLFKTVEVGSGVPDAENSYLFTAADIE